MKTDKSLRLMEGEKREGEHTLRSKCNCKG